MSSTELTVPERIEIDPPAPKTLEQPRTPFRCRHIFVDGRQCGSRALRSQNFCFYHQAHRTPVLANRLPLQSQSGFNLTRLDGLDNHTSIQLTLAEVIGRIANQSIDNRSAWLLLHGLQIASNNLRHARPASEAPRPEAIVEDSDLGPIAPLEEGGFQPESLLDRMSALLREDPNADLSGLLEVQT